MSTSQEEFNNIETENCMIGEKCGTITISIYKEIKSGSPIFHVQPNTEDVLPISYIIEDALSLY